ncbi:hypothetical protein SAMN04488515_0514 [Cognatiyoonia koreensis]|uniref:Lipoprotein n=1 Tax=Cognatiyoonia koreensis TaxID=364200 RepID=A0A1I0NBH6_9RHOB|nr:hypothetical protein [Cognatiyoonia koreensis]SEV98406.1 hypothetical protein SAMN04488515_0514 [Cognatiyoonia koreensis]
MNRLRKTVIGLILSVGVTGCATSEPANAALAPIFEAIITESEQAGPDNFYDFFTLNGARSDGDTLIIDVALGSEGQLAYDADAAKLEQDFIGTFSPAAPCDDPFAGPILTNGGTIRYEVVSITGRPLFSFEISNCRE